MTPTKTNTGHEQDIESVLHDFLGFMGEAHAKSAQDAGEGQEMLKAGVKTVYAQNLEKILTNPLETLYGSRKNVDKALKEFVNIMVTAFLDSRKELIKSAVKVDGGREYLLYCIALVDDTLDNRVLLNDFFDFYESHTVSVDYPVCFQYVPTELMDNIKYTSRVVG